MDEKDARPPKLNSIEREAEEEYRVEDDIGNKWSRYGENK